MTVFGAPALQARRDAKKALDAYREPLLAASYELQARLYNILQLKFVEKYISDDTAGRRNPAIESTLYVSHSSSAGGRSSGEKSSTCVSRETGKPARSAASYETSASSYSAWVGWGVRSS